MFHDINGVGMMNVVMSEENKDIKKYYIAYMDILGYKDFFRKHSDQVFEFFKRINAAVQDTKSHIGNVNKSVILRNGADLNIIVKMFSDNILLCVEVKDGSVELIRLLTFLSTVAEIQRTFITKYGLFLRGGVTIGDLAINNDIVFGQGIIDAVTLEETAIYPRIILSESVIEFAYKRHYVSEENLSFCREILNRFEEGQEILQGEQEFISHNAHLVSIEHFTHVWKCELLAQDADGVHFLNYLYKLHVSEMMPDNQLQSIVMLLKRFFPADSGMIVVNEPDYVEKLKMHREKVEDKLIEYGHFNDISTGSVKEANIRERVLQKYMWAMSFHNFMSMKNKFPECIINAQANCENRFMKMIIRVERNTASE